MKKSSDKEIYAEILSPLFRGIRLPTTIFFFSLLVGAISSSAIVFYLATLANLDSPLNLALAGFLAFLLFGLLLFRIIQLLAVTKIEGIEVILNEIKNQPVDFENIKSHARQRAFLEFEDNLRRPLLLINIESDGFDIFNRFEWAIQPRINVLLGRNGYGKTRILQAIVAAMTKDDQLSSTIFKAGAEEASFRIELLQLAPQMDLSLEENRSQLIDRREGSFKTTVGKMPILAIPDSRFINKSRTDINAIDDEYRDIRENGAYHFLYQKPYESIIQNFLYQLCIDYLKLKTFKQPIFDLVQDVFYQLAGQKFEFRSVNTLDHARFSIDVLTEGDGSSVIPIQNASQGTLSVLAMFGVIFTYLRALYPTVADKNLLQQRAIVFIDEIDAHLHPVWQRKIVTLLRNTFQNTQFVLTAHSPLVVAGCLDCEVAVLRRTQTNKFTIHQFEHDFIGWDADQIYRTVFDVEERDESFKTYSALYADRDRIEGEIKQLSMRSNRSAREEQALKELRDKLYYIDKTQCAQNRTVNERELQVEIQRLQMQLERLSRTKSGATQDRPT